MNCNQIILWQSLDPQLTQTIFKITPNHASKTKRLYHHQDYYITSNKVRPNNFDDAKLSWRRIKYSSVTLILVIPDGAFMCLPSLCQLSCKLGLAWLADHSARLPPTVASVDTLRTHFVLWPRTLFQVSIWCASRNKVHLRVCRKWNETHTKKMLN